MLIFHIRNKHCYTREIQARGGKTLILDFPFPDFSNDTAPLTVSAHMGLSICHKDDNFDKKAGRVTAMLTFKPEVFKLECVSGDELSYVAYRDVGPLLRRVSFTLNKITRKFYVSILDIQPNS